MKQKIIAAAIASTLAVPFAVQAEGDNTWYGRVNTGLQIKDMDGTTSDIRGYASRFGVKGSSDLGNGLSVIYQFEFAVDSDIANIANNNRVSSVGLSGSFGTVKLGKNWGAGSWANVGSPMSPHNVTGGQAYSGTFGNYRMANSVQYSGGAGPVNYGVDVVIDGADTTSSGIDNWTLGGSWAAGGISVGAAYADNGDSDAMGAAVSWSSENIGVVAGITTSEDDAGPEADGLMVRVNGAFGDAMTWSVVGNSLEDTAAGDTDSIAVNVTKNMGKGTALWMEADFVSSDSGDYDVLHVGIRKNF